MKVEECYLTTNTINQYMFVMFMHNYVMQRAFQLYVRDKEKYFI